MAAARRSFRNRFSMRWRPAERRLHHDRLADAFGPIGNFQLGGGAPQALEIVEAARLLTEHVHDEPAKIEQRPFGRAASFPMLGRASEFFVELLFDLGADRLYLWSAEAGANEEVGGECSDFAQVDDS